jgi:hypothetical protein
VVSGERAHRITIAALAGAFLVLVILPAWPAPAAASGGGSLAEAEGRLERLTAEIGGLTGSLQAHREQLAAIDDRIALASTHLGTLEQARRDVLASVERAQERRDAVRQELSSLAAEAFMDAGPGILGAAPIEAFLQSGSLADATDSLAFADVAATEAVRVAGDVSLLERDLQTRVLVLDALAADRTASISELETAREERVAAAADEAAAFAALDAARREALEVVQVLRDQLAPGLPIGLGDLADALQGGSHVTYGRWAELFLRMVGAPTCRGNLVVLAAWQAAESTQAAWNPLATTHRMPGSTDFNSVGVQDFRSLAQGLRATWETLENGWTVYRYGPIVTSLRRCGSAMQTALAINASSWCPGCVGGRYVLDVIPHVQADLDGYLEL